MSPTEGAGDEAGYRPRRDIALEVTEVFEGLLQPTHLILILVIALVVFGPGKLPEMGAALGKGIKEFRQSMSEITDAVSTTPKAGETPKAAEPAKPAGSEPPTQS